VEKTVQGNNATMCHMDTGQAWHSQVCMALCCKMGNMAKIAKC